MNKAKKNIASDFDHNYYKSYCGSLDYISSKSFIDFFKNIARYIKDKFDPKTVLDAGCACGHLVAALRELGIEAYGVDISEYAISQVREDIRPYCMASSLTSKLPENFPEKYDLVTNIEVIEHMYEDDSIKALELLCQYSDRILFSSTPDDFTEKTHVNVQTVEYWFKQFAKQGLYPNMKYDMSMLSPQAMIFERSQDCEALFASCTAALWQEKKSHLESNQKMNSKLIFFAMKIKKVLTLLSCIFKKNKNVG